MVDRFRRSSLRATVTALREGGAVALELGFPFSDPIADGPVLEAAHERALQHGTTWADLLAACRTVSPLLPTAVMTYANPVWHRGIDRALHDLDGAGASGLIVPDLSLEESAPFVAAAQRNHLSLVLLAAPGLDPGRLRRIARASRGFLYLVARYGTTGAGGGGPAVDLRPLVGAAHRAAPDLPVLLGFGVRDRATARAAWRTGADGVIVGSALEERLRARAGADSIARWFRSLGDPKGAR
jgi:tryptophan synthase alpha chain